MSERALPGLGSELERRMFALLAGAIFIALAAALLVPLPHNGVLAAGVILVVAAVDVSAAAFVARRLIAQHETLVSDHIAQNASDEFDQLRGIVQRAEQQAREAERLATAGRVAAGIAHEIGNPLTGIANFTHVLRARAGASREAETALAGIEREVDRIDRIVSSLLDYAKPKSSDPAPFDAAATLRAAVQLLAEQGVFRRVEIHSAIDDTPIGLVGNSHELEQAFVNLLLNAIDAMESQGTLALFAGRMNSTAMSSAPRRTHDTGALSFDRAVNPRLDEWRSRVAHDQPCVKFVIADSGNGVACEDASRVFDPFFTTKAEDGSGLGLAIVQRVVDAHNGVVWVQRAREGGAAFHVVLPLNALGEAARRAS